MKKRPFLLLYLLAFNATVTRSSQPVNRTRSDKQIVFTENKGQVMDQAQHSRTDILFGGSAGHQAFHLRKNGISYQHRKVVSYKDLCVNARNKKSKKLLSRVPSAAEYSRLDVTWKNCNENAVTIAEDQAGEVASYYGTMVVENVRSFRSVTYKELYKGIDLHYYSKGGSLKYDFIVAPGADYREIRLEIKGSTDIDLQPDGSIKIETALGTIIEEAPVVFQNGRILPSEWRLRENVLSFEVKDHNPRFALRIDPITRIWGTYYGGPGDEEATFVNSDPSGDIIICGLTSTSSGTTIATTGAYQQTFSGGMIDAFIAKFNSSGIRQWATYYGGSGDEIAGCVATDSFGNIVITGFTDGNSGNALATAGTHQLTYGGGSSDIYIAKFTPGGTRIWSTYYGGSGEEDSYSCSVDGAGNIFVAGITDSNNNQAISTTGSHQQLPGGSYDAFIVKFDASGNRLWGSYYGGTGDDWSTSCDADGSGNVFFTGATTTTGGTVIATSGSHQSSLSGQEDAYLIKFSGAGLRQWGTYYGGSGFDEAYTLSVDNSGNVYIGGDTESASGIASQGAHQSTYAGGFGDAFITKFDGSGSRLWGTYYGSNSYDDIYACTSDAQGDLYFTGTTSNNSGFSIVTLASYQTINAGNTDAYVAKFSSTGLRLWGTYYGGSDIDVGYGCAETGGDVYVAGYTESMQSISSMGSHQQSFGGSQSDAFLVRLGGCIEPADPLITTASDSLVICAGKSAALSASGSAIAWYAAASGGTVLAYASSFTTGILPIGTYTYYAEAYDCTVSISRVPVTLTVTGTAPLNISTTKTEICAGESVTITASGAATYTWSNTSTGSTITVQPVQTTIYSVTGTDFNNCSVTSSIQVLVTTCTGIDEEIKEVFAVFPNPTGRFVTVRNDLEGEAILYDQVGQKIRTIQVKRGNNIVELPDADGIYLLRCGGKKCTVVKLSP